MSLNIQLDYLGKNIRPYFELKDLMKEGKLTYDKFTNIFMNKDNDGIDIWIT